MFSKKGSGLKLHNNFRLFNKLDNIRDVKRPNYKIQIIILKL